MIKTTKNELELNKSLISKENYNPNIASYYNKRWSDIHASKGTQLKKDDKIIKPF